MDEFYDLIGGYIEVDKKIFISELLKKDSNLRFLINRAEERHTEPEIEKLEATVRIKFDNATELHLEQNYKEFFTGMKIKLKEKLKGRLIVRVSCSATFLSNIDFNRFEDKVFFT